MKDEKSAVRRRLREARSALAHRDALTARIWAHVAAMPAYRAASGVMFYVDARGEVATREAIEDALRSDKKMYVPYCEGDDLAAFRLRSFDELARGAFGIWEPRQELRSANESAMHLDHIDVVFVPGVGFDRLGHRIGSGRGYYDRFLPRLRAGAVRVGLAFACQLLERLPVEPHDVPLDWVVTEDGALNVR